ncbi:MAG: TonB-dependent receptor plug domain-containing protein [Burkholderiales bacterium]|nr:TonB-dependent receptor plug domain-containing protein [Burkholderiales bacterium]
MAGRKAKAISGKLSGIEAINAVVEGTGLTVHVTQDGAVVVRALPAPAVPASSGSASTRTDVPGELPAVRVAPEQDIGTDAGTPQAFQGRVQELSRVEITGSRLWRVDAEGPAPVNVYTKKDIERSGQPSLQRFLAGLSEVSASTGEGGFGSTLGQGTVQLRGLPLGSTLVLINGRRVQGVGSSTGSVFNLNLIPMAAIERVEVVPLGSSAVYGGDALEGVVNVILKKSIDGQSLAARLGSGRGFGDGSLSLATGGRMGEGSYLLMGSYSRTSPLSMQDRDFFKDADYRRFGGTDERLNYCAPGSVSSVDGTNLPGLGASVAGIPTVAAGQALRISDFQATAGKENLCNAYATGGGVALVHGSETLAVHSLAEQPIFGSWSAFGEVTFAKDRQHAEDTGLPLTGVTVPAGNPFNPFGVDVDVTAVLGPENGVQGLTRRSSFTRVLAGIKGELARDWDAELTASTSSDRGRTNTWNDNVNSAALSAALGSGSSASAINLFTAGRAASDEVLRGIWSDRIRRDRGRKDQVGGILRGTVGQLWAGPVDAIIGAETARDWYDVSVQGQSETHGTRSSSATYGEVRAPLLSAGEGGPGSWSLAALTLAARRDRYSDFGSASTFQGGLEVRPARGLLIRGSAANSFKPPTILQTHVEDVTYQAALFRLVDPARNRERITSGTVVRTTNKELAPERGQARGIGAVWEPEGGLGTRLSATYWQVRIRGMIAVLRPQAALDYESLFPGFVTRGPSVNGQPGVVTSVKTAEANFGRVDTSGTDVDAAYVWKTALGRLTTAAGATRTREYRVVLAPGAATVDRLGRRFSDFWSPRWKGRLSIGLDDRVWNLSLTSRYLGAYKDSGTSDRQLGDYWTHDLAAGVDLKKLWPDLLPVFKAASFGVSIANLTDREPQYVQGAPNYDVTQADWRGRYVSARLSLDW